MPRDMQFSTRLDISGGFSLGDLWLGVFFHKHYVEVGVPFFRVSVAW